MLASCHVMPLTLACPVMRFSYSVIRFIRFSRYKVSFCVTRSFFRGVVLILCDRILMPRDKIYHIYMYVYMYMYNICLDSHPL